MAKKKTATYGKSTGRNGNYSTNYQNTGRELMTPDNAIRNPPTLRAGPSLLLG